MIASAKRKLLNSTVVVLAVLTSSLLWAPPASAVMDPTFHLYASNFQPTSGPWGTVVTFDVSTNAGYVCVWVAPEGGRTPWYEPTQSCEEAGGRVEQVPIDQTVSLQVTVNQPAGYTGSVVFPQVDMYDPAAAGAARWGYGMGTRFDVTDSVPVPAAPSGLTATPAGAHAIQLTWQDNATNESGFVVAMQGQEQAVDLVGANITSYKWSGLQPGTQYCFYVASKTYGPDGNPTGGTGNQQSAWVGPVCATTAGVPINGGNASVSVSPGAVRSYETFQIQGHQWIPGGTINVSATGAVVEPSTLTVGNDGSFRIEMTMNVPPGDWKLTLVESAQGVTISKTVTLKVLRNPGRPIPSSPTVRIA